MLINCSFSNIFQRLTQKKCSFLNMTKLPHDATASLKGNIYQFHLIVDLCFGLTGGQTLYIERFGDIAISGEQNIEVKAYEDDLTDSHENFWKTLANWMGDGFDHTHYNYLTLVTTQKFGEQTKFKDWNDKNTEQQLIDLRAIHAAALQRYNESVKAASQLGKAKPERPDSLKKMDIVMMDIPQLEEILKKFKLFCSAPSLDSQYELILEKHAKTVLKVKAPAYINSLVGFILSPKVYSGNGWEVTYEDFTAEVQNLSQQFVSNTRMFPFRISEAVSDTEETEPPLYIKKIEDISYKEVIPMARVHHMSALNTLIEEFKGGTLKSRCDSFRDEMINSFRSRFRKACRKCENPHLESKDFYDDCMDVPCPTFSGFETPPKAFRNGLLHLEMDDEGQGLSWTIGVGEHDE